MLDRVNVTAPRDWLDLSARPENPMQLAAASDELLPVWLRAKDDTFPRTIADIIDAVARHRCISRTEIRADRRNRQIVHPRHEAMYWSARLSTSSLAVIGRQFSRDHTTVIMGIRAHAARTGLPTVSMTDKYAERCRIIRERTQADAAKRSAAAAAKRIIGLSLGREARISRQDRVSKQRVEECKKAAHAWCRDNFCNAELTFEGFASENIVSRHKLWRALATDGYAISTIAKAMGRWQSSVGKVLRKREAV